MIETIYNFIQHLKARKSPVIMIFAILKYLVDAFKAGKDIFEQVE